MKKSTEKVKIKKLSKNEIVPYWRNPRDNEEAVKQVKESIQRFGYQQLIVVDKKNVIIAGHTRYKALVQLGFETIDVIEATLSEKDAKAYRIADNKTSEAATWKIDELYTELREIGNFEAMQPFFPNMDLQKTLDNNIGKAVTYSNQAEIDAKKAQMDTKFQQEKKQLTEVICPHCNETFYI